MSWEWVDNRVKRNFYNLPKIEVFDGKNFTILSKLIEFLNLLGNKLNYLGFDLHFIYNCLPIIFFP